MCVCVCVCVCVGFPHPCQSEPQRLFTHPRYVNWLTDFNSVSLIEMLGAVGTAYDAG